MCFFAQQTVEVIKSKLNKQRIFEILCDVKSEQQLSRIYETTQHEFDADLLSHLFECAIDTMIKKFKQDCFQHNPHMNYLKLSPILKQSIDLLCKKMDNIFDGSVRGDDDDEKTNPNIAHYGDVEEIMVGLRTLLKCIVNLQLECMIYVEVGSINKFINEHIIRRLNFDRLIRFALVSLDLIEKQHANERIMNVDDLTVTCDALTHIIRINSIFNESDNYFNTDKCHRFFSRLLFQLYEIVRQHLASHSFLEKHQLAALLSKQNADQTNTTTQTLHARAIFLGAFIEQSSNTNRTFNHGTSHLHSFETAIRALVVATMRCDLFYFFAITPCEIINAFEWQCEPSSSNQTITFQSMPIDCLNEIEIVEKFLKRYAISLTMFCTYFCRLQFSNI